VNPANAPGLQGVQERGLHHILDKVEVPLSEDTGQHDHELPRLNAKEMLNEGSDRFRLGCDKDLRQIVCV